MAKIPPKHSRLNPNSNLWSDAPKDYECVLFSINIQEKYFFPWIRSKVIQGKKYKNGNFSTNWVFLESGWFTDSENMVFTAKKNLKKNSLDYLEIPWVTIYITQGKKFEKYFFLPNCILLKSGWLLVSENMVFITKIYFFEKIPWVRKIIKISNPRKKI